MKSGQETGSVILHPNAMGFSALKHISFCPCNIHSVSPKNKKNKNKTNKKENLQSNWHEPKNKHTFRMLYNNATHQPNKKMAEKNPPIL